MKSLKRCLAPALAAALLLLLPALAPRGGAEEASYFRAGAAKADITPDLDRWKVNSIGYASHKVMAEVHDPITCQALAAGDGAETVVLITCDLMGTPPVLRQKVIEGLGHRGIGDDNLLMACSHTHSGPGNMMPNLIARVGFGGYNEELTQWTAERIVAAAEEALDRMEPARLSVAVAELPGVTRNRRDPAGSYDYDTRRFSGAYEPEDPSNVTDPTLTVIRIDAAEPGEPPASALSGADSGEAPIAVLFHFATHGTVLGIENLALSADWVGPARAAIEEEMPGAVVMYMNGAQGDQAPAMEMDDNTDLAYLDIIGERVAGGVLEIVGDAEPAWATPVRSRMVRREVPPGDKMMGIKVPKAMVHYYFPELPLQGVRFGEVYFMALPLEAVSEIGLAMKDAARGQGVRYPVVAGLANDHLLYAATPRDFERGGYEVDNTVLGKTEAAILVGEHMLLARELMRSR